MMQALVGQRRKIGLHLTDYQSLKKISSLHYILVYHCNDKWCFCPFSDVMNIKWLEVMEFEYHLCHHSCMTAEKFSPGDLISHVEENHKGLLGSGVVMYLQTLYQDAFGTGEFIS